MADLSKALDDARVNEVNLLLREMKGYGLDMNQVSDGYHTFGELYEHRITLFIALCKLVHREIGEAWRSRLHSDGTGFEGWFVLGLFEKKGQQITYHLPVSKWDECGFAETLERAPEWDGHTSNDVLNRLANL